MYYFIFFLNYILLLGSTHTRTEEKRFANGFLIGNNSSLNIFYLNYSLTFIGFLIQPLGVVLLLCQEGAVPIFVAEQVVVWREYALGEQLLGER